jgi:NarL family two-component system response regulator LiaR
MADDTIRIMIADDNAIVRYGLRVFIELFDDYELVGEADTGSEAVGLCVELQPDIVLMDLVMPQMDGVRATEKIIQEFPDIKILVLTSTVDYQLIEEAMQAGAQGYLLKDVSIDTLDQAIRSAVS